MGRGFGLTTASFSLGLTMVCVTPKLAAIVSCPVSVVGQRFGPN
jgi:hypothetical protein